ncbi:DUF799 domain-containing protein [Pseudomonadales bacterium]|nr:DUF799 domain-containing protein [Pseudomonadales bacterium]
MISIFRQQARFLLGIFVVAIFATGCTGVQTESEAYPRMYNGERPLSIVVVPAINKTTAADAGDLMNVTLTQPLADNGYYVLPIAIASEIFKKEGIVAGEQLLGVPTSIFRNGFGADAVLFVTINKWEKSYILISGSVTVGLSYVMLSTDSNEVLWSYKQELKVDTSGGSANPLSRIISSAISTALTDYLPIARQVNALAALTLPYGSYHPKVGQDGDDKVVLEELKDEALIQE